MIPVSATSTIRLRVPLVVATAVALVCGGLVWSTPATAATGEPQTYIGHSYSSDLKPPSADKPQSKLWWHDGSWWGLLVEESGTRTFVHELLDDHTWRNTGALVDSRTSSTGDALWEPGTGTLSVASRVTGTSSLQVSQFGYDAGARRWTIEPGFPVSVNSRGGSESASIDRDSTGRLWVTYTRGSKVWVAVSDTTGRNWTDGFLPPVADTSIKSDDLSAVIAFGTSIGVMWSDQDAGVFRFAIHDDGAPLDQWRFETVTGPSSADDHINLKQLVGDPQGRVFAAVKTSADDVSGAAQDTALVGVLTRHPGADGTGSWAFAPGGTVADDHSRPLIMIDQTHQELYFFATAPVSGGDIFYKKAPLSNIAFGPGRGTPFIDTSAWINNASGAKHPVTDESGLVILAVAHGKKRYVHGEMQLGAGGGPTGGGGGGGDTIAPTATTAPADGATDIPAAANVTATFSEPVQGVSAASFTLAGPDGSAVTAAVSYDTGTHVATLDPAADLIAGTRYTATLTGGVSAIRDDAGNPLTTTSWAFTTAAAPTPDEPTEPTEPGDTVAPTITWRSPAPDSTDAWLRQTVSVTFSEEVQGVGPGSFTLRNATTGAPVTVSVFPGSNERQWKMQPDARLANLTAYTVTLAGGTNGIRDLAGNAFETVSWNFTTR